MDVLVHRHAVVEAAVVERQRDVVLDVERAVGVVCAHTRQTQALPLVAHVHAVRRVVDRVETDHALVHVRAGVIHAVIVEPEEALLLALLTARRPVQIQVVDPHARLVAMGSWARASSSSAGCRRSPAPCDRCAGGSRTTSPAYRSPGDRRLSGFSSRWLSKRTRARLAVLGVDHRPRERTVEPVDRARSASSAACRPDTVLPAASNDTVGWPSELIGSTSDEVNEWVLISTLIL